MLKLSIIIPTYNSSDSVERTIKSIESQKGFSDCEIICIDDGSTDDTWNILLKLASERKYLKCYKQKNQKQATARNNGISHASGKYIMFADADDYWLPGLFENIVNVPSSDCIIFGIEKKYKDRSIYENYSVLKYCSTVGQMVESYLSNGLEMDVGVWNKVFLNEILRDNDIQFKNGNFFEDNLFVLEYLIHVRPQKLKFIEKPYYVLIKHANTTTNKLSPEITTKACSYLKSVEEILENLKIKQKDKKELIVSLRCRLILHVSHHYMLYDADWSAKSERKFLKGEIPLKSIFKDPFLNRKYKIAWICLILVPGMYRKIYLKMKPSF